MVRQAPARYENLMENNQRLNDDRRAVEQMNQMCVNDEY